MADVPDLAIRTHRVMEDALRDISRRGAESKAPATEPSSSQVRQDSPAGGHEVKSEEQGHVDAAELGKARRQDGSEAGSIAETGSTVETESDEGMVIVGRPT